MTNTSLRPVIKSHTPSTMGFKGMKAIIRRQTPANAPCPYCLVIMERSDRHHPAYISIDHVVPYSRCQEHNLANLIATCARCNTMKSSQNEFSTFQLTKPQKLSADQVNALSYLYHYQNVDLVLQELRILIFLKDFKSIKEYKKEFSTSDDKDAQTIVKVINHLNQAIRLSGNKKAITHLIDVYKLSSKITNTKDLVEAILDTQIEFHSQKTAWAKNLTAGISFKEKKINALETLKKLRAANQQTIEDLPQAKQTLPVSSWVTWFSQMNIF